MATRQSVAILLDMSKNPIDFAAITASAKYLNQQSDSLHDLLASIQSAIVKLGIGLEVWLTGPENFVRNPADYRYGTSSHGWTIGLTKYDRSWCVAIREAYLSEDDREIRLCDPQDNITPLLEAPRERRVASLKLIPALVTRLNDEATRAAKAMDEAIEQARSIERSLIGDAGEKARAFGILTDDDLPF